MSSPTYLTLCCENNTTDLTLPLEKEVLLRTSVDSTCLVTSCFSLFGIAYLFLPRHDADLSKTLSTSQTRILSSNNQVRKVIHLLIFCEVMADIGLMVRSALKLSKVLSLDLCVLTNIWIQFFVLCTYFWNIAYGVEILTNLKRTGHKCVKYVIGVLIPLCLCSLQAIMTYYPTYKWSLVNGYEKIIVYLSAYLPIAVVIIINPVLFYYILKTVRHLLIGQLGKFTGHERGILEAARLKFTLIMLVYVFCWFSNLLFVLVQTFEDRETMLYPFLVIALLQAICNPLQGLFNCVVFRGWPGFRTSCTQRRSQTYAVAEDFQESLEVRINVLSQSRSSETEPILEFRGKGRNRYTQ